MSPIELSTKERCHHIVAEFSALFVTINYFKSTRLFQINTNNILTSISPTDIRDTL